MSKKLSIGFGVLGIITLIAFQWAIVSVTQKQSFDTSTSAATNNTINTSSIKSSADAYTSSSYPSRNFGRESKMYTQRKPEQTGYIKFDLSKYKGTQLGSVTLKIRVSDSEDIQLIKIAPSTWDEYQINHANKPLPVSSVVGKLQLSDASGWKEILLPFSQIQPYLGSQLTLVIESTGADKAKIFSRESSYPPQLLISVLYPPPSVFPTCTQMPTCMLPGANPQCVVTPPAGGWCPPANPRKIQGLKITTTSNSLTLNWDAYPSATLYGVYRNKFTSTGKPMVNEVGPLIAKVTQTSYSDMVAGVTDLFADDATHYYYTIQALNGDAIIAQSDVAGEFDYDVMKNKILFVSFPYRNLPFSDFRQLTDVLRSQGIISLTASKWNTATQAFRIAVWNSNGISGENFTIEPYDTVIFQSYTLAPEQTGRLVFSGVFSSEGRTVQLKKGINMLAIDPEASFTQAIQLGNALIPQIVKIYNTKDAVSSNLPFIRYVPGSSWEGVDFPLYKGMGYFVELSEDISITFPLPLTISSKAGDVNGDNLLNAADPVALSLEMQDNDGDNPLICGGGSFRGATGADINRDGKINAADITAMSLTIAANTRAALPGDVNGDLMVDAGDYSALVLEIGDDDGNIVFNAGKSSFAGTMGADVNGDTLVNDQDLSTLKIMLTANTKSSLLGDANGDGYVTSIDFDAISKEVFDGDGESVFEAGRGTFTGALGADVNQDLKVDAGDLTALALLFGK